MNALPAAMPMARRRTARPPFGAVGTLGAVEEALPPPLQARGPREDECDDAATDTSTPPRLATLADIHRSLWLELGAAVRDRRHEWRTPVLATADAEGSPDARTVVLREVEASDAVLRFYSDARGAKVSQLQARPLAMLVMWSARLGWQLRIAARAQLHTDGLAVTSRWATLRASPAARDYLSPLPPGAPLGDEPASPNGSPRMHFAMVELQVQSLDWLELHPDGHRRARFDAHGQGQWLTP